VNSFSSYSTENHSQVSPKSYMLARMNHDLTYAHRWLHLLTWSSCEIETEDSAGMITINKEGKR
jgi:hypothetical protein